MYDSVDNAASMSPSIPILFSSFWSNVNLLTSLFFLSLDHYLYINLQIECILVVVLLAHNSADGGSKIDDSDE